MGMTLKKLGKKSGRLMRMIPETYHVITILLTKRALVIIGTAKGTIQLINVSAMYSIIVCIMKIEDVSSTSHNS